MQQAANSIHKIRDPLTKYILFKPEEIEKVFKEYYENLYTAISKRKTQDANISQFIGLTGYWRK